MAEIKIEIPRKQITLISEIVPIVEALAEKELRSFPNMLEVLATEALETRKAKEQTDGSANNGQA